MKSVRPLSSCQDWTLLYINVSESYYIIALPTKKANELIQTQQISVLDFSVSHIIEFCDGPDNDSSGAIEFFERQYVPRELHKL